MKKKLMSLLLLAAVFAVLSTGCAPPHRLGPPPAPPGAPAH